jgi:hypothetical protein
LLKTLLKIPEGALRPVAVTYRCATSEEAAPLKAETGVRFP